MEGDGSIRFLHPPDVVPRGDVVAAQLQRPMIKPLEFEPPVAVNAGVGGSALLIAFHKRLDDLPVKIPGEIKGVVGDAQSMADTFRVLHIPEGAAGALPLILAVIELHGHADAVVALLF